MIWLTFELEEKMFDPCSPFSYFEAIVEIYTTLHEFVAQKFARQFPEVINNSPMRRI